MAMFFKSMDDITLHRLDPETGEPLVIEHYKKRIPVTSRELLFFFVVSVLDRRRTNYSWPIVEVARFKSYPDGWKKVASMSYGTTAIAKIGAMFMEITKPGGLAETLRAEAVVRRQLVRKGALPAASKVRKRSPGRKKTYDTVPEQADLDTVVALASAPVNLE